MKTLSSFRFSEKAKQSLQNLSKKHEVSQAELIEIMLDFAERPENEFSFEVVAKAFKTEKNPAFKKFKAEYEKLNPDEQKIMWQKMMKNGFKLE